MELTEAWESIIETNDLAKILVYCEKYGINTVDEFGWTPLLASIEMYQEELALTLLEMDADHKWCEDSVNLLRIASHNNMSLVVKELLKRGADIDAQDHGGTTALMRACDEGNLETVRVLVETGANLTLKTGDGETALDYAKVKGHDDIADYLTEKL